MITDIRIKNLRCLKDTKFISLKKFNVLLGMNSSGKSTFLRSFPLMLQTLRKDLQEAICWFDEGMVDFGDFKTAINKDAGENEKITFSYRIKPSEKNQRIRIFFDYLNVVTFNHPFDISLSYGINNTQTYLSSIVLKIYENEVSLYFDISKKGALNVLINGSKFNLNTIVNLETRSNQNSIIPQAIFFPLSSNKERKTIFDLLLNNIGTAFDNIKNGRLKTNNLVNEFKVKWVPSKEVFLKLLQKSSYKSLNSKTRNLSIDDEKFVQLFNSYLLYQVFQNIYIARQEIGQLYDSSSYIAPVRAEALRYSRSHGLQTREIDPFGRNLSDYIASLTQTMKIKYTDFIKNILGVNIDIDKTTGHTSIVLKTQEEKSKFNLMDVGFGYSQILPILTQLWNKSNFMQNRLHYRPYSSRNIGCLIAMEQPELHLHPALQVKLTDALIQSIIDTSDERNNRIIIETHSETIINRIGRRIREKRISPNDVNVILFTKDINENISTVKEVKFDEQGRLVEWPYGFFDPED